MTNDKIKRYYDLALEIFESLNGTINLVNKSIIPFIYTDISDNKIFGEIINRSTLVLYIRNIIDKCEYIDGFSSPKSIKFNILFTIIHELYHADQNIDFNEYNINDMYNDKIEKEVDYMTILFILTNRKVLEEKFNVEILEDRLLEYKNIITEDNIITYNRTDLFSFYNNTLSVLFKMGVSNILYNESDVYFQCNDKNIVIKTNNQFNQQTSNITDVIHSEYNIPFINSLGNIIRHNIKIEKTTNGLFFISNIIGGK